MCAKAITLDRRIILRLIERVCEILEFSQTEKLKGIMDSDKDSLMVTNKVEYVLFSMYGPRCLKLTTRCSF
jgi:hypothetical protein